AGVLGDLAQRHHDRLADDLDAEALVVVVGLDVRQHLAAPRQRHAAARHDAFLDRCTCRMQRVVDAVLALLHLDLGRAADANDGHATGELRQPLLQLLAVVVRGGLLDLRPNLVAAALDVLALAGALDDRGVLLLDENPLGLAEHVQRDVLELDAEILADHLAAGQDRDVLEHRLAAIAEARRLDRRDLQAAAQLVDDECRQRLALDVLGDDQQRTAGLHDALQQRQHRLQAGQLLLVDQDVRLVHLGDHLLGVRDEVRAHVAAVELHALDDVELGLDALGLLDRDDALVADLLHRLGDHLADLDLAVRADGADLRRLARRGDLLGALLQLLDDRLYGLVDAALEVHRVHARGHRLRALADDRLRQHRRRGGTVTGGVAGLAGDRAHHLRAHVLELVGQFDFLGDGHAVLGDARGAEALVEHDVAALGAQRHLHRVGENVDAAQHPLAGVTAEANFLRCHVLSIPVGSVDVVTEESASGGLLLEMGLALDDAHD